MVLQITFIAHLPGREAARGSGKRLRENPSQSLPPTRIKKDRRYDVSSSEQKAQAHGKSLQLTPMLLKGLAGHIKGSTHLNFKLIILLVLQSNKRNKCSFKK